MARVILGALVLLLAGLAARVSAPWAGTPGRVEVPPRPSSWVSWGRARRVWDDGRRTWV